MSSRSIDFTQNKSVAPALSAETTRVLVMIAVAVAIVSPTIFWGIPSSLDLSNHFRFALPFYDALRTGHLYPGWLADSNHGFGDPSFRFYPPALYYLLALTRTLFGNWYAATVITFSGLSVLGATGVYLWAREFGSSETAMWSGILYSIAPYHINQFFQAVMLAEFAGAAVMPFAFAFTERVCRHRRKRDIAGLATAYAILILTHLPLAVIGSIALAVYALLRIDRKKRLATLSCLAASAGLALAASACYWTTMLFELNWIRADNINPEPGLDYRHNFVLSTFSPESVNVWWMNILLLSTVSMFWPALALLFKTARPTHWHNYAGKPIKALAMVVLLTIFMATPVSRPLWNLIHPLQETQFPWRWLALTSMVCPILMTLAIPFWARLAKGKKRPLVIIALGTMAISIAFSLGHIVREARWLTPGQFEQTLSSIPGSTGVYYWMPIWTPGPLPTMASQVEADGGRKVFIESWEPERRVFRVGPGAATDARVATFYYPHWQASAQGQALAVHPDQSGALVIGLPKEAGTITLEFREPKRVRYADGLTLIGWLLIGALLLRRRTRN